MARRAPQDRTGSNVRGTIALLRWLGPWAKESAAPADVTRETWVIREGNARGPRAGTVLASDPEVSLLDAYVYRPATDARGLYLISPGLHFAGPDDPRLDRFCRVLSAAGFVVVAPFLPSYVELVVVPSAVDDLELALHASAARFPELGRPSIFSISFGSWPAFELAARCPDAVDGLITFGGYADFESVARFCLDGIVHAPEGDVQRRADPLNRPALFLNLLRFLDVAGDPGALVRAWNELCYRTWGRMELKEPGRLEPYVDAIAAGVPAIDRELFRVGGTAPGAEARLEAVLASHREALAFLSPRRALAALRCPVVLCHGRDDDVIPWTEALALHAALAPHVPVRLHLTGLYAHTGQGRPSLRDAYREVRTLLAMVRAIASGGRLRETIR